MKKNLITVIILALVIVNLVLTAILTITIVPEVKKANELVTKVCNAIDLDLQAGDSAGSLAVKVGDVVSYDLADSMTINLADSGDGKSHYAILSITISLDSKHEDYATFGSGNLSSYESRIKADINQIVAGHTMEDMKNNTAAVQEEILKDLQAMFGSSFIVKVGFSSAMYQ